MNAPRTPLLVTHDVYDVAQLAGGLSRVVDTAVVALLERGRLTVDSAGRLQAVGTAVHPVEAAVLELAGPRPRRSITTLRGRAQEEPRLTAVAERLVAAGLLRRNPLAGLSSSWPAHLRTAAGRQVLAEWRAAPPVPNGAVALNGSDAMADQVLRRSVFGSVFRQPDLPPGRRAVADPGASTWVHGGWSFGGWGGDGGGGGGFGGGDGGGCGGGDGGGGGGGC